MITSNRLALDHGGNESVGYNYHDASCNPSHAYLLPAVLKVLDKLGLPPEHRRIFDLGCGNGSIAKELTRRGWDVTGVDPSPAALAQSRQANPELKLYQGSAYDDLASRFGQFPVVLSLEVVEHLYFPRKFAACAAALLVEGGCAIISTPYHGYWKNLAIALCGKMDAHWGSLIDHWHIKFWSVKTLTTLLTEAGFRKPRFFRVGRIPALARSMIAVAVK